MSLMRARFVPMKDGQPIQSAVVEVELNPDELTITKQHTYKAVKSKKTHPPRVSYSGARARKLSMELFFDTTTTVYGEGPNARHGVGDRAKSVLELKSYERLVALTDHIPKDERERKGERQRLCRFIWGSSLDFVGYVDSLETRLTLFATNGEPVRAIVKVSMVEAGIPLPEPNPAPPPTTTTTTVPEGASLALLAAQFLGNPRLWREIAEANEDPGSVELEPGRVMAIPGEPE